MEDWFTIRFKTEDKQRIIDIFERLVADKSNYSLQDADILTRMRSTIKDATETLL